MEFEIKRFSLDQSDVWDQFLEKSTTAFGTFLHSRRFLSYHPTNRFIDHSLMIYEKSNLIGILPSCEIVNGEIKFLSSHRGSTFGGLVLNRKFVKTAYILEILKTVEDYCRTKHFTVLELKLIPNVYCLEDTDVFQYIFQYLGYSESKELSTYVDLKDYSDGILKHFEQGKRTNVNNCMKEGLVFTELLDKRQISDFFEILCANLKKFNTKPVHSLNELLDFKFSRLSDIVKFYGIYSGDKMLSGGMTFYFKEVNFQHTQYLCADSEYNKLSPMTFLYYSLIKNGIDIGLSGITWGTSTEKNGKVLNEGLIRSKEAFGSKHYLNLSYTKYI